MRILNTKMNVQYFAGFKVFRGADEIWYAIHVKKVSKRSTTRCKPGYTITMTLLFLRYSFLFLVSFSISSMIMCIILIKNGTNEQRTICFCKKTFNFVSVFQLHRLYAATAVSQTNSKRN